jgi:PAS domain S-box-containing protein
VAVLIVLTFFGTYFFGRRETLQYILPIMQLSDTARKFGEGKWDIELHDHVLQRQDEIGIMAQSFNGMALQLKDLFNSLEQRVTELKQTQDALKKSGEHYRSLFDGVPIGLYRTSPDGKIIDANPMLAQMLGYPDQNTFLSISAQDFYVDPNDRAIWQSRMKEDNIIHSYETRMRKYDGTEIWIENHSRAVKDEYGKVLYYEGSIKDTTESKRAQAALKKSEESFKSLYEESQRAQEVYRSLIHSSADAIVIYDLEVKVTYVSPMFTQIFGWSSEELTGKQIPFLPESEKQSSEAKIKDVIENGTQCQNFETKRITRDGRLIDVSISASRYDDHKGNPAGMLVIFRDISERKRFEAHLQHMERMEAIGTLAGGIAHDFNNLLMVIRGSVSLMLRGMKPSHPHYKHCLNIETQSQRGSKLASHLLGYARKGKYEVKPLNLNEIILESMETYSRTRKDINIHYELSPDIRPVEVDIYQIEQVLMNLYINAFDAMMDGGDLLLITKNVSSREIDKTIYDAKPGNYVMLMVKDTGIGMDQKTMDRIFEPFFTTKEVDKGTGLGLASVYGIVQGHGGYISVASEIGQGAAFSLYFPASEKIIEALPSKTEKAFISKGTILLIDDEKMVLDVGASMLSAIGYTVIEANNGQKGIEIYQQQQHRIDLIILDMIMPDISGSQAFDLLREINPHVAILLSSGYSIEGKAMEIMDRGCNGFIQKPYNLEDLAEKIKKIMSARSI